MKRIKVLVVDDSLLFRETLAKELSADPQIEVVAKAADPFDARDKILACEPDVMTLDVEMPRMNGIEFLRRLLPQYPLPTVVISALSDCVFEATRLGAVDFIRKPDAKSSAAGSDFFKELILKVKTAAAAKVKTVAKPQQPLPQKSGPAFSSAASSNGGKVIVIGASTGGTVALTTLLTALRPPLPGIVVVQHIPPVFSKMFAERLDAVTKFEVKEAESGDEVKSGRVLIAPGDRHLRLKRIGPLLKADCFAGEKVNGHCPSVDVLFHSAVPLGKNAVGVILTGMGYDGAKGLLAMRRAGARTIGQDEASSVVYGMPMTAYNIGAVEVQVPLEQIAAKLCAML